MFIFALINKVGFIIAFGGAKKEKRNAPAGIFRCDASERP